MIPTNHHHPQSRYDMEIVMYTQRIGIIIRIVLHWGGFCHVSKSCLCYSKMIWTNQSKLATWHVWCGTNIGHVWCETNIGHILVRNKCRTCLVRNKYRTFSGAEQMSDVFWCGTNTGHYLPGLKIVTCQVLIGYAISACLLENLIDDRYTMIYDKALIAKTLIWRF